MARRKKSTARRPSVVRRKPAKRKRANPTPTLLLPFINPVVTTKAGRRVKIDSRNKTKASRLLLARKAAKKAGTKPPYSVKQGRGGKKRLTTPEAVLTLQRAGQTSRKRKAASKPRKRAPAAPTQGRDQFSVASTWAG